MDRTVLFLCTGNSARSQMAEAIVNAGNPPGWKASSAGTHPADEVHPLAIHVLKEKGIEHSGNPRDVELVRGQQFDLVVTVCDSAAEECPLWLGPGRRVHIGFPDPAQATGEVEEVLRVFRKVRDEIHQKIPKLLSGTGQDDR